MPWGAIVAATVCAYGAHAQQVASYPKEALEVDLERLAREHRARVEADTRKTLRDARIGTVLILAFVITAAYGIAQLSGFA